MPKASIIIPVYKVEKYLKKCVDSVLNQTYKDIEVILVDDGSPDNCPEMCDRIALKDKRVKVIHKENGGQGEARNVGLESAKGEYIIFVDSDDYVSERLVEETVSRAEKYNADMVIFDYVSVDEKGEIFYKNTLDFPHEKVLSPETDKFVITSIPSPVTQIYRKSLFENRELRFVSRYLYEDLRLIPKLFPECKRVVYADTEPLYFYLKRDNSTMRNGDAQKTKNHRIAAINDVITYFKNKEIYEKYSEELDWMCLYHGFYLPANEILMFKGKYFSAINELRKNLKGNVKKPLKNKYISTFSLKARAVLYLLYFRFYFAVRLILKIKK